MPGKQVVLLLVMNLALCAAAIAGNVPRPMRPLGILAEKGTVRLDGQAVPPFAAIFPGDRVATGSASVAVLKLEGGAMVSVASKSAINLPRHWGLEPLRLARGAVIVSSPGPRPTEIAARDERVEVGGDGFPALCRIASIAGGVAVYAERGRVLAGRSGRAIEVPLGRWVRVGAGYPPAGPQKTAGSVTNEIPTAMRQPVGQKTLQTLSVAEAVDWNDLVRTLQTGRVRIALLDGSVLNIGARSEMRIVDQHPRAQQTDIQLTLGIMRAKVVKLTQPHAHFQVRTQTAVIGVVGTEFIVEAGPNFTRVWCLEGVVQVWNLNPAVVGKVQLHPSQTTTVRLNLPPSQPTTVNLAQINKLVRLTTVRGVPPAAPTQELALRATTLGEMITSASLSGLALSRLSSASSAASQASSNASAASAAAANALAAAGNAVNAATNAVVNTQNVLNAVSPATPASCGCQ